MDNTNDNNAMTEEEKKAAEMTPAEGAPAEMTPEETTEEGEATAM